MKSYIIILLIALISCSKFIQKQKRIKDINLKSKYSIIQDEMNKIINDFLISLPETIKSFIYVADNANFDKILNDFKELNKNAENFLKVNPFDKLVEREKKMKNQISSIRLNSHVIMNYIKENKFSDELLKIIKKIIDKQTQPIYSGYLLLESLDNAKNSLSDQKEYEKILNRLKNDRKNLPNNIKNVGEILIKNSLIYHFQIISQEIDEAMPEIIKNLKETFPKIQAIFHNKKKIEEFKLKFKTFFIFKNIASVEDFDIVIKSYEIIFENLFKVFKFEYLYKYLFLVISAIFNDLNIFIHGIKDRKYFFEYYINLIEKIFTTYNTNNLIVDFKEAMNSLRKLVNRLEKKELFEELGINKLMEEFKEKVDKMKEENLLTLCKEFIDYFKMVLTKY